MSLKVWLPLNGNLENKGCGNATITGNLTYVDGGKLGKARSAGKITISKDYMTEIGTMCFWINVGPETITAAGGQVYKSVQTKGRKWDLFLFSTKNSFHSWGCVKDESTNTPNGDFTLGDFFPNNTWVHVAVAHDKKNIYVYRNGELYHTKAWSSDGTFTFNGPVTFAETNEGILYNDLRIYDECLTAKQIKEISKGLVVHYTLDKGIGNPNILIDTNKGKTKWGDSTLNGTVTTSVVEENGISCFKADRTEASTGWQYTQYAIPSAILNTLTSNTDYTVSMDFKSNVSFTNIGVKLIQGNATNYMSNESSGRTYDGSQNWKKLTFTIKTISDFSTITIGSQVIYISGLNKVGWYMIKNLKLEKGKIASSWCPNVNDALYKEMKYDSLIEKDVSGNGYHGIRYSSVEDYGDTPRYSGCIYKSNRTEPHIILPANKIWSVGSKMNQLTIAGWYNADAIDGATKNIVCIGQNSFIRFGPTSTTNILAAININGTSVYPNWTTPFTLATKTWYHYAITFKDGVVNPFINGISLGAKDLSENGTTLNVGSTTAYIGGYTSSSELLSGAMSDIRIYSTALSAEDIKELYNTAAYVDKDGSLRTYELVESGNEDLTEGYEYTGTGQTTGTYTREDVNCPEAKTGKARKITCTAAGDGFYESGGQAWQKAKAKMINGQKYVWSLYCKSDNITSMKFSVECSSAQDRITFTIGPEYRKLSNVFTYSSETTYSAFTSYTKYVEGDNVYIHSFKVEPYNPNLEIMKTGVYKENDLSEGIENQLTMFKQGTETREIIEI